MTLLKDLSVQALKRIKIGDLLLGLIGPVIVSITLENILESSFRRRFVLKVNGWLQEILLCLHFY